MNRRPVLVFRHVPHEGLGALAAALRRAGLRWTCADMWRGRPRPPAPAEIAALVVMGGPMGVYEADKYPFLKAELSYLKKCFRAGVPVLGVCLGSQLIARALGARVYPNKHKEIGWFDVRPAAAAARDPLLRASRRPRPVFQWHGDTFDLPRGARRLASSPLCRNQAFRWGDSVWGLQFHLEVTRAMARDWLRQPGAAEELRRAGAETPARILAGFRRRGPSMAAWGRKAFAAFAARAKRV